MEPTNQSTDLFPGEGPKKLPSTLNTLTILTFIGCGIAYISAIYSFFQSSNIDKQRAEMEEAMDKLGDNEMATKMMNGSMEVLQKSYDNRYLLLIIGLVFTTFCLLGALQMRKLKKSGYPIYVAGELLPIVFTGILLGFNLLSGMTMIIGAVVAIVFVILYSTQRKHLVY